MYLTPATKKELINLSDAELSFVPGVISEARLREPVDKAWNVYKAALRSMVCSTRNTNDGSTLTIKAFRDHTGVGLKESKEFVDAL